MGRTEAEILDRAAQLAEQKKHEDRAEALRKLAEDARNGGRK